MNKTQLLGISVVVLIVLNVALLVVMLVHKPPPPRHPRNSEGPKLVIIERLHFDEQQVAKYEELIAQHRQQIHKKDEVIRNTKNKLYSSLANNDMAEKDSLMQRIGALQGEVENIHYRHFQEIKALCKPDQLDEFDALAGDLARLFSGPPPK